jgi:DNA-binding GntR family transcriptional regulator
MTNPTPTRLESTFTAIRQDIITGTLAPGSRLGIERRRHHYGVGSSTIREALSLLLADALVTSEGQRGFTVSPISLEDLKDLSRMRILLEAEALADSIEHGTDEWEAGIVAAYHRLSKVQQRVDQREDGALEEWELRNLEFHHALTACCRSKWISYMLDMLNRHSERYRRIAVIDQTMPRQVDTEHQALMEAALDRDVDLIRKISADHILRTVDVLSALYAEDDSAAIRSISA